jgi:tRNA 2-thiocytidine biosynthesis protein TtcA
MKHTQNILKRIGRTVIKHNLIAGGDKILIALSGGKDSLVLLEALAECRKNMPVRFDLMACHIHIGNMGYSADIPFMEACCGKLAIPFIVINTEFNEVEKSKKGICFLCSWHRRKALFELTKTNGCNKIAFGHHMDDALETLFMNMIYHGSISSMPYDLTMFGGRVRIIRPLLELTDKELENFARLLNLTTDLKACPYADSRRKEVAHAIDLIAAHHKAARKNIFRSMNNIYPDYLPNYLK